RDRLAPPGRPFQVRVSGRTVAGEVWGEGAGERPLVYLVHGWGGPRGPGGGRPLVYLVHGWGGRRGQLEAFAGPLAEAGHRVVAFDALGHGDSDPGPSGPGRSNILELVDALAAVVAAHGPAAAVVPPSPGATAPPYPMPDGRAAGRVVFVAPMADPLPHTRT